MHDPIASERLQRRRDADLLKAAAKGVSRKKHSEVVLHKFDDLYTNTVLLPQVTYQQYSHLSRF